MMEIYPFGGILAYLKYFYLDGIEKQYLLLIDKTRINYGGGKERMVTAKNPKSTDEVKSIASMFGIGTEVNEEIEKVRKEIGD